MERKGEAGEDMGEGSGGVLTMAAAGEHPPASTAGGEPPILPHTPDSRGKTSRCPRGEGSPLIIDMEEAWRVVSGSLVVGHFLSPFQVNPRIIIDELRAAAWKLQGVITFQEVASEDRRFILNFAFEEDRWFVLKAQPWHYKRDGIIFIEFDGKGNPTEVDLRTMAIWAQVRDLPFEIKTESMGCTLGDQLGE